MTPSSGIKSRNDRYGNVLSFREGLTELDVYKAKLFREKGLFWCSEHSFCSDDSADSCGKVNCKEYAPRNGKNGRCKYHHLELYTPAEKVTLKFKK